MPQYRADALRPHRNTTIGYFISCVCVIEQRFTGRSADNEQKEKLRLAALITAGSLAVVGLAAAVCVVASPHQPQEEGEWLTPSRLDLSSVLSSQAAEQEQKADTWPKVPVPGGIPITTHPSPPGCIRI